jgi:organic hydroperoxide reductase OsmC/OhrA
MKARFPHAYSVEVSRTGHGAVTIDASPRSPIEAGPPPEFGGEQDRWSPEHLLLSAIGSCVYATFEAFAAREKLDVLDYHDTVRGMVDRSTTGLALTGIGVEVEIAVLPDDVDRAKTVFERAKTHCLISNALRVPPAIALNVRAV